MKIKHNGTCRKRGLSFAPTRILLWLTALTVLLLIVFGEIPLSGWLLDAFRAKLNSGAYVVDSPDIRLNPLQGFFLRDTRIFAKGRIGPPVFEAENVVISLNPLRLIKNRPPLSYVKVENGCFRPNFWKAETTAPAETTHGAVNLRTRFVLKNIKVKDVIFEEVGFRCHSDKRIFNVQRLSGRLAADESGGNFQGDIFYDRHRRRMHGELVTDFDLKEVKSILSACNMPGVCRVVERFEFEDTQPHCEWTFSAILTESPVMHVENKFYLRDCKYRGVDILRGDGAMYIDREGEKGTCRLDPLIVIRPEGIARATFTTDFRRNETSFELVSALQPEALCGLIGIPGRFIKNYRFNGPSTVTAQGMVAHGDPARSEYHIDFSGRNSGVMRFIAEDLSFQMNVRGFTNELSNVRANIFNGELNGQAQFVGRYNNSSNTWYELKCDAHNLNLDALVARVCEGVEEETISGNLRGNLKLNGMWGKNNTDTLQGEGYLRATGGKIYMLPLFGGLSGYLARMIPGLDFVLSQTDVKSKFTIGGGKIHSDKILIEGDVFSFQGKGDYYFSSDLNFDAEIRFLKQHTLLGKLVRIPTYIFSKLFEFRLRGSLNNPHWYPVNFSPDLLEKIGLKSFEPKNEISR